MPKSATNNNISRKRLNDLIVDHVKFHEIEPLKLLKDIIHKYNIRKSRNEPDSRS